MSNVPTKHLALDYEAISPSQDEVLHMFTEYLATNGEEGPVSPINVSYGAVRLPRCLPTVVVSVDFCEVLRQTGRTCGIIMGNLTTEYPYAAATGLPESENMALVRGLMKADRIAPAEDAEAILYIMQAVRAQGGLVIGNTSTLPGCEEATLRFIGKHYPGAFDGINFNTGGHAIGGNNRTKAQAILTILRQIDPSYVPGKQKLAIFSIDDRPHHNRSFDEAFKDALLYTYAPRCIGETPSPAHGTSTITGTPLKAFEAMYTVARGYLSAPSC